MVENVKVGIEIVQTCAEERMNECTGVRLRERASGRGDQGNGSVEWRHAGESASAV